MNYFKESIAEIKKVTWPTKNHAINITIITIIFTTIATLALTFIDGVFKAGYTKLIDMSPKSSFQNLVDPAELGIDTSAINITDSEGNTVDSSNIQINTTPVEPAAAE
ncbi:preprotein translocase subunit SecE [bacterium]|jgi:preprotein translocase SecE subunit|nr:preprotein translocase subunit SecE [bacterium]